MSKEVKTGIAAAIVAVLALGAWLTMGMLVAFGVLVAGGLGVIALLQRMDTAPSSLTARARKKKTGDDPESMSALGTATPLTTWTPPDTLQPWSPPTHDEGDAPVPPAAAFTDVAPPPPAAEPETDFWSPQDTSVKDFSDLAAPAETTSSSTWLDDPFTTEGLADAPTEPSWADDSSWADGSTWDGTRVDDGNPLDDLARLDEVDVIAEFERLDDTDIPAPRRDPLPLSEVLSPINEAVSSADDIMAASQATELGAEQEDNSELAKLLAKVQARLAAYE